MTEKSVGAQLVDIVEELAMCQKQLEDASLGEGSVARLETLTIKLAKISEKLFRGWMNDEEECGFFSPKKDVKQLDLKKKKDNIRKAPLCKDGVSCSFGLRGRCAFFHPEPEKSKEMVMSFSLFCDIF